MNQSSKKGVLVLILSALLLLASPGCGTAVSSQATEQSRIIRAGVGLKEDHPQGMGLALFKEIVEQKSEGRLQVDPYYSGQLGDDLRMTTALQAGTMEITIPSTSPLVGMVPEYGIFDFPFLFRDEGEADAVLDGPVGQELLKKLPEHGLVGLGYWENGFRNLTNDQHPVNAVEDFRGLKIRTMQNEVHIDAFKALGANPSPMPLSELFSAMETGVVDGQENPLATIETNKYDEVQKHLSLTEHVYTPFVFLVSKKFWDELPSADRNIIRDAARQAGLYQREENRKANRDALARLEERGMKVNRPSTAEREGMEEKVRTVIERYTQKYGDQLVEEMMQELEKTRRNH